MRATLKKNGELSEDAIHKAVIQCVSLYPKFKKKVIHIPNEGKRTITYANYLKALGFATGASDLIIFYPNHGYHGAAIELKSIGGRVKKSQQDFLDEREKDGYFAKVTWGLDEALAIVKWYLGI